MGGSRHSLGMARKLRLQYPGAIYHPMSRGDRRELFFLDDTDRQLFLSTLAEVCAKTSHNSSARRSVKKVNVFSICLLILLVGATARTSPATPESASVTF